MLMKKTMLETIFRIDKEMIFDFSIFGNALFWKFTLSFASAIWDYAF